MGTPSGTGTARGPGCKAHCSFSKFLLGTPETLLEAIPCAVFLRSNVIYFFFFNSFWGHFHAGGDCCLPVSRAAHISLKLADVAGI